VKSFHTIYFDSDSSFVSLMMWMFILANVVRFAIYYLNFDFKFLLLMFAVMIVVIIRISRINHSHIYIKTYSKQWEQQEEEEGGGEDDRDDDWYV